MPLPILDGAAILREFAVGALTVRRKAVGTYSTGTYVPSATVTTLSVAGCSVQDPDAAEMEMLPEGVRQEDTIKIYSPTLLRTADPVAGHEADELDYQGITYRVLKVGDWNANAGYYKVFATRVGH